MKKSSEPSSKTNINKSLCQFSNIDLSKEELIIMFKAIYDEDLISHINKLSSNIKQFYLEHESIFTRIYNQIKQTTQPELVESIKQLDQCFEEFYGNAKIIFKDMKDDRNNKNEKMDLIQQQNPMLKSFISENIFSLKKDKKVQITKRRSYNHRSSSKIYPRELSIYNTQSGNFNSKHKNITSNINSSINEGNATKTQNQQSDITKIKYFNIKKENTLLKQKIEILERKASMNNTYIADNDNSNLSPKRIKFDYIFTNVDDSMTHPNKTTTTTNYTKIVNNVNNTINNIDSAIQKENDKIKDNIHLIASKIKKLLIDMDIVELNKVHNEISLSELEILKKQIELNKESIIKLIGPYLKNALNNNNINDNYKHKDNNSKQQNEKGTTSSTKNIKVETKKTDPKTMKETINTLKLKNQKMNKRVKSL